MICDKEWYIMKPNGNNLLATLVRLLAEQEGVKIKREVIHNA
jgi:hypothetical protein